MHTFFPSAIDTFAETRGTKLNPIRHRLLNDAISAQNGAQALRLLEGADNNFFLQFYDPNPGEPLPRFILEYAIKQAHDTMSLAIENGLYPVASRLLEEAFNQEMLINTTLSLLEVEDKDKYWFDETTPIPESLDKLSQLKQLTQANTEQKGQKGIQLINQALDKMENELKQRLDPEKSASKLTSPGKIAQLLSSNPAPVREDKTAKQKAKPSSESEDKNRIIMHVKKDDNLNESNIKSHHKVNKFENNSEALNQSKNEEEEESEKEAASKTGLRGFP